MIQQPAEQRIRFPKEEAMATTEKVGQPKSESTKRWSKTIINFWLDALMLLVFVALLWVATVVRFVFPAAANSDGWTLWFGSYDQWVGVQFAVIAFFALLVLIHVMLHWPWVCGVITSRMTRGKEKMDDGTRTIVGVGFMIVLLNIMGLAIAIAALTIHGPS
jgi:hypothetical protein